MLALSHEQSDPVTHTSLGVASCLANAIASLSDGTTYGEAADLRARLGFLAVADRGRSACVNTTSSTRL
jgi:hypothetical protein